MSDREEFEEAASRLGYNLTMAEHETGEYNYRVTQDAWDIWQEAKEQAARAQEGGEAVATSEFDLESAVTEMIIMNRKITALQEQLTAAQPADIWIKCSERMPTEADGPFIWPFDPEMNISQPVLWCHIDPDSGDTHWMPTGLKRPNPPRCGK